MLGLNACHKDPTPLSGQTSTAAITFRSEGGGYTPEQQAALEAHLQAIASFRAQVHAWRTEPTGASMPAAEAIEKTEIAFNLYQGNPTVPFEFYESIERDLAVSANENWTPAQVVAFYDTVKAIAVQAIGGSTNRRLHVLSLSNPEEREGGGVAVRVMLQVGINPLNEPDNSPLQTTRWAAAPRGHTNPTPCTGAADDVIGARANQAIGVYLAQNAAPMHNTPLPGRVVSPLYWGVHKLSGPAYIPPDIPPAWKKAYEIYTENDPNLRSRHYNSVAYHGANPPWNCLTNSEIDQLVDGNLFLGRVSGRPHVPAAVRIGNVWFNVDLICTRVIGDWGERNASDQMKYQEHVIEHYFGLIAFIVSIPVPIADM